MFIYQSAPDNLRSTHKKIIIAPRDFGAERGNIMTRNTHLNAGQVYQNKGGGSFLCIKQIDENVYQMLNIKSGWMLEAHEITIYEDDTIEWDYSSHGYFSRTLPIDMYVNKMSSWCANDLMYLYAKNTPGVLFHRNMYMQPHLIIKGVKYRCLQWSIHPDSENEDFEKVSLWMGEVI